MIPDIGRVSTGSCESQLIQRIFPRHEWNLQSDSANAEVTMTRPRSEIICLEGHHKRRCCSLLFNLIFCRASKSMKQSQSRKREDKYTLAQEYSCEGGREKATHFMLN